MQVGKRTLLSKKGHFCPADFKFLKIGLKRTLLSTQGSTDQVARHLYPLNVKTTMNNPNSNRNPPATPTPSPPIPTTLHSNTYVRAKTADFRKILRFLQEIVSVEQLQSVHITNTFIKTIQEIFQKLVFNLKLNDHNQQNEVYR